MTHKEFIKELSKRSSITNAEADKILYNVLNIMEESLIKGDEVTLNCLGKLTPKFKKSRIGVSPATGEKITIAGKTSVVFKMSKLLKNKLN